MQLTPEWGVEPSLESGWGINRCVGRGITCAEELALSLARRWSDKTRPEKVEGMGSSRGCQGNTESGRGQETEIGRGRAVKLNNGDGGWTGRLRLKSVAGRLQVECTESWIRDETFSALNRRRRAEQRSWPSLSIPPLSGPSIPPAQLFPLYPSSTQCLGEMD